MKKRVKIGLCLALSFVFLFVTACGNADVKNETRGEAKDGDVTLRFFTTQGEGLVEQKLLDDYMAENPHVTIEIEALENEAYKQKFKAYVAGGDLADIFYTWSYGAFFNPLIEGGYVEALNEEDYVDYTFSESAVDALRGADGTLYGLPRSFDSYVVYYNTRIFEENNIEVPETFEELIEIAEKLRANGIMPASINGGEKWSLQVLLQNIYFQYTRDNVVINEMIQNGTPKFVNAEDFRYVSEQFVKLNEVGFFQDSYLADDYAAMQNLFQQEQVAMMYMGNWLNSMHFDPAIPEEVRENISAFALPPLEGAKGTNRDNVAMVGGAYALNANSDKVEEARKLLNYMMRPEGWCKTAWELSGIFSAQDMTPFVSQEQRQGLQGVMLEYMNTIEGMTGQPFVEVGSPAFKTDGQDAIQEMAGGMITVEQFLERMDSATARSVEAVKAGEVND